MAETSRIGNPKFGGDPDNPLEVGMDLPDQDLRVAGRLLRAAQKPSLSPAVDLDRALIEHMAYVVAERGIDFARAYILGYWYPTGVRNHATVAAVLEVLR